MWNSKRMKCLRNFTGSPRTHEISQENFVHSCLQFDPQKLLLLLEWENVFTTFFSHFYISKRFWTASWKRIRNMEDSDFKTVPIMTSAEYPTFPQFLVFFCGKEMCPNGQNAKFSKPLYWMVSIAEQINIIDTHLGCMLFQICYRKSENVCCLNKTIITMKHTKLLLALFQFYWRGFY